MDNIDELIERLRGRIKRNATEYIADRKEAAEALETLRQRLADSEENYKSACQMADEFKELAKQRNDALAAANAEIDLLKAAVAHESDVADSYNEQLAAAQEKLKSAEFWSGVYPDGWTAERIANEMHDYNMLLDGMDVLYEHITGGKATKPNTSKSVIMSLHDDHINEIVEDAVNDATIELTEQLAAANAEIERLKPLSVENILIAITPGDGSGYEVYAKSVEDVEKKLGELGEKAEDFELETKPLRNKLSTCEKQLEAAQLQIKTLRGAVKYGQLYAPDGSIAADKIKAALSAQQDLSALHTYGKRIADAVEKLTVERCVKCVSDNSEIGDDSQFVHYIRALPLGKINPEEL